MIQTVNLNTIKGNELTKINDTNFDHILAKSTWTGLVGYILGRLGYAFAAQDQSGRTFYIMRRSLFKAYSTMVESKSIRSLEYVSRIHSAFMKVINPIKGHLITVDKVRDTFKRIHNKKTLLQLSKSSHQKEAINIIESRLSRIHLKDRNITILPYQTETLLKNLKPGDILFRRIHEDTHNNIVTAQRYQYKYLLSGHRERKAFQFSHVCIYVGNGKVAEAAWPTGRQDEIRRISLEDRRFAIATEGDLRNNEYLVVRPKNQELAEDACKIAERVTTELPLYHGDLHGTEEKQPTKYRYSILLGSLSMLFNRSFGLFAKDRYIKQYHDFKTEGSAIDFIKPQDFFCSYLVGYCYQVAEAQRILPKIIKHDDKPVKGFTRIGTEIFKKIWTKVQKWKHMRTLDQHVQFKLDPKRTGPQVLRNFIVNNPHMFEDVYLISRSKTEK